MVSDKEHSDELMRKAIECLSDGVLITDDELDWPSPKICFVNEAVCRISGYSAEELIGNSPRMLQGTITDRGTLDRLKSELSKNQPCNVELVNYRKDGTPYDVEIHVTPIFDASGRRTNFVAIHRDISERKRLDRQLRESESRLAAEADALSRLTLASSRLWQLKDLNLGLDEILAATIELLGADMGHIQLLDPKRDVLTLAAQRGFGGECLEPLREVPVKESTTLSHALRSGLRTTIEDIDRDPAFISYRDAARKAGYRGVVLTPLTSHDNKPLGIISTHFRQPHLPDVREQRRLDLYVRRAVDFIERCQTEAELKQSEEKLRAVLRTAADSVININAAGTIVDVNSAALKMFGYSEAELIGSNVNLLMPSPYKEEHDRYIHRYLRTKVPHIIGIGRHVLAQRKDGSVFPVSLAVSEVDHLGLFTGIIRDITELHKLQREILTSTEDENRRIGRELHDGLQQELAGLGLLAHTLCEQLNSATTTAASESCRSLALAQRIKEAISRTHQELRSVVRGLVPANLESEGIVNSLRDLADRTDQLQCVQCAFKCEEAVEIEDNETATHLFRIAQEAVANALKHGSPQHILISLEEEDGHPLLKIIDDGIGFKPEQPTDGLGLKTMHYRAGLIGASLSIVSTSQGGAQVACKLFGFKNHRGKASAGT